LLLNFLLARGVLTTGKSIPAPKAENLENIKPVPARPVVFIKERLCIMEYNF
jgi:hypothetical protein